MERLANAYGSECERTRQDLAISEAQLRDYQERLGKPFLHEAYLTQLTALRDELKAGLSGIPPETETEAPSSVSELAGKIKALVEASSIEATPKRAAKRQSSAEEPVTARILRRGGT